MKNKLTKNSLKSITKNKKRFLSILIMSLLGVGFFSGLVATGPDMKDSLDEYLDSKNCFDISIVSTMGLTDKDIEKISDVKGVENVVGTYDKDSLVVIDEEEYAAKIIGYNSNINDVYIVNGRLPKNNYECVVNEKFVKTEDSSYKIGDKIKIVDESNCFIEDEIEIVGTVQSPLYMSSTIGNTSVGNGTLTLYIYVPETEISLDYFTSVYLQVGGVKKLQTGTKQYAESVQETISNIENIQLECEQRRKQEILDSMKESLRNSLLEQGIPEVYVDEQVENTELSVDMPKWYITDRDDNIGYHSIVQATESISNISKIFPIVFYVIAVLISLTSMTRLVEEERIEIGTLKSLGYTNVQIVLKYVVYAGTACTIGGIIGMLIGFKLIPSIIWNIYKIIYYMPIFNILFRFDIGLLGLAIAFMCIVGATIYVAYKELKSMPSVLMRPKAPKNGKRVVLENIKFIWNRLNFSQKVTIRNLFRYKKRVLMTIIGITGCTALILSGFGLKDSITNVVSNQYGKILKYDAMIMLKENIDYADLNNFLSENGNIKNFVKANIETGRLKKDELTRDVKIIVPDDKEELKKVINLYETDSDDIVEVPKDGILITDKLSQLLEVGVGDKIILEDSDENKYEVKINKIVKNYVDNYVYMSKELYETTIKEYTTNVIYLELNDTSKEIEDKLKEDILNFDSVSQVVMLESTIDSINDMLGSLNYVVVVLIVAAALLAFVVLYNLSNINISERKREIATLKVLGFYNKEVDSYINRESVIFTIIGIILGLIAGYYLCHFMITTCEVDSLRFTRHIFLKSYIVSALMTVAFTVIVNIIIHFQLKKIDMIESLKSIE